ncbi:PseG/SpsG family protein [Microbacterium sp. 22215]|uniref:PseG/SpsG family protein n=1 Tax=Microbacterium sp. 22215 TaxID=3453893 RepID=UPI003F8313F3
MRCLIRADAGEATGTGHVMRCLTIAEELKTRGHEVVIRGDFGTVPWLSARIAEVGVEEEPEAFGVLSTNARDYGGIDVVIVDSYVISSDAITHVNRLVPTLAVVDGDTRGIEAEAYLDQNLGATGDGFTPGQQRRLLAGSRYALVRREIRDLRRSEPRELGDPPHICAFMGGSDPTGAMVVVTRAVSALPRDFQVDLVVTDRWRAAAAEAARPGIRFHQPTPRLPDLLARADLVISATGTSAWDLCTMGVPSIFTTVVDNQRAGYASLMRGGLAVGVDFQNDPDVEKSLLEGIFRLIEDAPLRRRLWEACTGAFDGRGSERVADAVERLARVISPTPV